MQQYSLIGNRLILKVKKSPILVRITLALLSLFSISAPVFGLIYSVSEGSTFILAHVMAIVIFGGLAYYLLKMFLWNSYGSETIVFESNLINYQSDYGWFKGAEKTIPSEELYLEVIQAGWEEDQMGNLILTNDEESIHSAIKIPFEEIKQIIEKLENKSLVNYEHSVKKK